MSDDLLQITWTHTNRTLKVKARQKLFESLQLPYGRSSSHTHTTYTHVVNAAVQEPEYDESSSVWLARADYSESTTLSRGHLFLNSQMLL